ncbi:MAG TPA: DUF4350 domain-containing protein [Steroidobacteraceae bacterium]|jgi:hypothetical protein|nr:DUF4350 domain-containing protein [Steroidobacteraceae bacterium]
MKREALVAPMLALGALALFYTLFFPKVGVQSGAAAPPLSTERGPTGLAGAAQWLRQAGVPVVSLRDRYAALGRIAGQSQGNLLISSLPARIPMHQDEQQQLLHWVGAGNTLLILAAIDDTPAWAAAGSDPTATVADLTHIYFRPESRQSGSQSSDGSADAATAHAAAANAARGFEALLLRGQIWAQPRGHQALMEGVHRLSVVSDLPTAVWRGTPAVIVGALAIAERVSPQPREAALWVEPYGDGQIILSAFASPFSNAQIDAADNARLLANIVAWSRSAQGRVVFDDAHQGAVDFYDPQAFFSDPRLHHTLEWILIVWLIWVLGSRTLRSGQPLWQPIAATTLMEASARFFSARVPPASAAQQLLANFYDEIHRRRGEREDGSAPWEWLAAQPALAPESLAQLREQHARVQARAAIDLTRLQNLLSQIRGSIQ